ncbi:uncharacterized protein [Drosophila bipectinata]|uniref:uncharacterized protein n=1 Tax=Drosophila bipectinata TaxID=42026 RepID=UPI001C89ED1F|nr:uncharacterized protein LOC108126583 [Drosophila bipectinata]
MTSESEKEKAMLEGVEGIIVGLSHVIKQCQSSTYSKLELFRLQNAIGIIDRDMLDYPGAAKGQLDQLRSRCTQVLRSYDQCVNPVFGSSLSMGRTLNCTLPTVERQDLGAGDKEILWGVIAESLNKGKASISESLDCMSNLQTEVASLTGLLDQMLVHIKNDYTELGSCTKTIQDLRDRDERVKKCFKETKKFLKDLYKAALQFFENYTKMKKVPKVGDEVVDPVIDAIVEEPESNEQKIDRIQVYLNCLTNKINEAKKIVDEVLENLKEFQKHFRDLENRKRVDGACLEGNPELIRRLKDLNRACQSYNTQRN